MAFRRTSIATFAIANNAYIDAEVSFFTVDARGERTATLATLYDAITGMSTLSNPQTLDSTGKFSRPVYAEVAVIGVVSGSGVADHETDIVYPALSDADVTAAAASAATATGAATTAQMAQNAAQSAQGEAENARDAALAAVGGVKVTMADATTAPLAGKLVAGNRIALTTNDPGGAETLVIGVSDLGDGVVGAPGLAFTADPDTGLYRSGDGELAFASNGRQAARLGAGGLVLNGRDLAMGGGMIATNGGNVVTGGGNVVMGGGVLRAARGVRDIGGAVQAVGKIAGNYAFSFARFIGATLEPTANITITAVNWPAGYAEAVLEITGGGDHTITTTSFTDVGEVPTLATGTGRDILILYSFDGGATRYLRHGGSV